MDLNLVSFQSSNVMLEIKSTLDRSSSRRSVVPNVKHVAEKHDLLGAQKVYWHIPKLIYLSQVRFRRALQTRALFWLI
jgi:hypothetical protein